MIAWYASKTGARSGKTATSTCTYRFQASIQAARSQTERLATGFCWAMTTSPSPADVSLERRSVNAGVELAPYRAGYRDSGSNVNVLTPQDALLHLVRDQWLLNWWWRGRSGRGGGSREGRGEPRCGRVLLSGVARRSGSRGR